MKKFWDSIVKRHWEAFYYNAGYFLLSLPFVLVYAFIRKVYYAMQGKNYYGQTPEEEEEERRQDAEDDPFYGILYNN
jgi:hypothetical protein